MSQSLFVRCASVALPSLVGLVVVAFASACGAPEDLDANSSESALVTRVRGVVSAPDSACNATVNPKVFTVAPRATAIVELVVPAGSAIRDWQCTSGVCKKAFVGGDTGAIHQVFVTRAGDPGHTSGASFGIVPAPSEQSDAVQVCVKDLITGKYVCHWAPLPACCTCPCDANPGCQ